MKERWAWGLGLAAAAAALALLAAALYDSLFPIFLGFGLAYAFDPLADRLEEAGLGRTAAVCVIMGGVALAAAAALALLLPVAAADAGELARQFPVYFETAVNRAFGWAQDLGIALPQGRQELLVRLRAAMQGASLSMLSPLGGFVARFFSGAAGMLVGVLNLLVMPVVFFYFLRDLSRLRAAALRQVPRRRRQAVAARLAEADRVFSGYLRGQMSVALILAVLYAGGLTLVGIRFGAVIGLIAGLLNVVPYVGVLTGLVLSLTMALVDFAGWDAVFGVLAVFAACQALEGFYITPRVVGDKVGLRPVETIIALIVGGESAGLLGLALAIPVAGCLKTYAADALAAYRRSALYTGQAASRG